MAEKLLKDVASKQVDEIFRWRQQEPERNKSRRFTGPPRPSCLRDVPPKLVNLF